MALIFAVTLRLDCAGSVLEDGSRLIGRILSFLLWSYLFTCACAQRTTSFLDRASLPFRHWMACSASCLVSKLTKQYPRGCPSRAPDLWKRKSNCFTVPNFCSSLRRWYSVILGSKLPIHNRCPSCREPSERMDAFSRGRVLVSASINPYEILAISAPYPLFMPPKQVPTPRPDGPLKAYTPQRRKLPGRRWRTTPAPPHDVTTPAPPPPQPS